VGVSKPEADTLLALNIVVVAVCGGMSKWGGDLSVGASRASLIIQILAYVGCQPWLGRGRGARPATGGKSSTRTKAPTAAAPHHFFAREVGEQGSRNLMLNHSPLEDRTASIPSTTSTISEGSLGLGLNYNEALSKHDTRIGDFEAQL
jgi:hypothetical protein